MEFYRYEDVTDCVGDTVVRELVFESIGKTPQGHWIREKFSEGENNWVSDFTKWVSMTTRKRYAYPTKKEALNNFHARKKKQVKILKLKLQQAKDALYWAEKQSKEEV